MKLNDDATDGGDPTGTFGKRGAPPVTLVLAATVSAKLVPPIDEQRMATPTSNVLDGVRMQLVAKIAAIKHVLMSRRV